MSDPEIIAQFNTLSQDLRAEFTRELLRGMPDCFARSAMDRVLRWSQNVQKNDGAIAPAKPVPQFPDFTVETEDAKGCAVLEWRGERGAFWTFSVGGRGPFRPIRELDLEQARCLVALMAEYDRLASEGKRSVLPESKGDYVATLANGARIEAFYNPATGHWIKGNREIGFGLTMLDPDTDTEQKIVEVSR